MVKNKWKVASVILMIVIVILGGILYYQERNKNYDFDGIEFNKKVFDEMVEIFPKNTSLIRLCRIEDDKCVVLGIEEIKE